MSLDPSVAAVRNAVRRVLADGTATVLVACSGGADSLALVSAAVFEGHKLGRRVVGVTVDHGLQDGSAEQARRVVEQMALLGVDETVAVRVDVAGGGQGPEAAAREARYAVLAEVSQRWEDADVLLGHTLDDQAETVLLGLTRGSGARSLSGMRRGFDCYRRPLLDVTRARTEAACRAQGLHFWTDPHNEDPRFTRSRVRHRVLPVLEEELTRFASTERSRARRSSGTRRRSGCVCSGSPRSPPEARPRSCSAATSSPCPSWCPGRPDRSAASRCSCPATSRRTARGTS